MPGCATRATTSVSIKLPALVTAAVAAPALHRFPRTGCICRPRRLRAGGLRSLAGMDMPKVLPPDEAFLVAARCRMQQTVKLDYTLTPDTYLYRDKLAFVVKSPADVKVASVDSPAGDVKDDPSFGRTEVYHRNFAATLALSRALAADEKLCWKPPGRAATKPSASAIRRSAVISRWPRPAVPQPRRLRLPVPSPRRAMRPTNPTRRDRARAERRQFLGGRRHLLRLWPAAGAHPLRVSMIPILSGISPAEQETHQDQRLHALACLRDGMAITYRWPASRRRCRHLLSNALQNPWALGIGAGLFVLLALSDVRLLRAAVAELHPEQVLRCVQQDAGRHFAGVFVMGALSAVIVGPCVGAAALPRSPSSRRPHTTLGASRCSCWRSAWAFHSCWWACRRAPAAKAGAG